MSRQNLIATALFLLGLVSWWFAGYAGQDRLGEIAVWAIFAMSLDLVTGYAGTSEIMLAMERREVDAQENSWNSVVRTRKEWIVDKKINLLIQAALERSLRRREYRLRRACAPLLSAGPAAAPEVPVVAPDPYWWWSR